MSNTQTDSARSLASAIAAQYRKAPESWTVGSSARDCNGDSVYSHDPRATCWCLIGMSSYLGPDLLTRMNFLGSCIKVLDKRGGLRSLAQWNDDQESVDPIIQLCEEVALL